VCTPICQLLGWWKMTQSARPLRADAARNRERVLEVAYKTFATEGLSVPIDEIARRAGVGTGTVYRHFPSKDDLVRAIVADRLQHVIDEGHALLQSDPGEALFTFLRSLVLEWGVTDVGLKAAVDGSDIKIRVKGVRDAFLGLVDEFLRAAQQAGTVRPDVNATHVKTLVVGCQAMQTYNNKAAKQAIAVVFDGLRAPSA
jgi:AcrR family transcriptional regulator